VLPSMASLDSSWSLVWTGDISSTTPAIEETEISLKKLKPNVCWVFPSLYMSSLKSVFFFCIYQEYLFLLCFNLLYINAVAMITIIMFKTCIMVFIHFYFFLT
jgi:hypothetical protein